MCANLPRGPPSDPWNGLREGLTRESLRTEYPHLRFHGPRDNLAWGGRNPFGVPFLIVTHGPEDKHEDAGFTFVNALDDANAQAREAAGGRDVFILGGADVIR